jgi:hypothetical protein
MINCFIPVDIKTPGLDEICQWSIIGSTEGLREQFKLSATRAGIALGASGAADPLYFWLNRLFGDLVEHQSHHLFAAKKGEGGMIMSLLEACVLYCARLERVALENEHRQQVLPGTANCEPTLLDKDDVLRDGDGTGTGIWEVIEISFFSEHWVRINVGGTKSIHEFGQLGLADGRSGKPTRAWQMLHALAASEGILDHKNSPNIPWKTLEKRMQEVRKWLRKRFGISADPLPYSKGSGYRAKFRIKCAPSYQK